MITNMNTGNETIEKMGSKYYYYPERELNVFKCIKDYLNEYKLTGVVGFNRFTNETMIEMIKIVE
jgi:hypothetical protein